jgi:hypothetical protein
VTKPCFWVDVRKEKKGERRKFYAVERGDLK